MRFLWMLPRNRRLSGGRALGGGYWAGCSGWLAPQSRTCRGGWSRATTVQRAPSLPTYPVSSALEAGPGPSVWPGALAPQWMTKKGQRGPGIENTSCEQARGPSDLPLWVKQALTWPEGISPYTMKDPQPLPLEASSWGNLFISTSPYRVWHPVNRGLVR